MSFHEFLNSTGDEALAKAVSAADFNTPLEAAFHNRLIDRLRTFFIIGGMPEVVQNYILDVGMHQRLLGLDLSNIIVADDLDSINSGNIAEIFTALEILSYSNPETRNQLFYWHRESKSSNAEVDYILQKGRQIIPLEVKAGTKGQMQSMRQFMAGRDSEYGIRISLENFSCFDKIKVLPLYAIYKLFEQEPLPSHG